MKTKMSPLQIAGTSVLLLACVYLSVGAHIPAQRRDARNAAVARGTGSEAINAKAQVDDYFKYAYTNNDSNVTTTCSNLVADINLPRPQDVPGCDSMVNASTNFQYFFDMYSHVVGLIYLNSTNGSQSSTSKTLIERLDLLEMIHYRLSKHMQRYLQAHNLSCGSATFFEYPESDNISALMENFTYVEIANVTLCHLRDITKSIMSTIGQDNSPLRPYKFCRSVSHIKCFYDNSGSIQKHRI